MGSSDLGVSDHAAQSHLRELWEQALLRSRVSHTSADGLTKFGVVESAFAGSVVVGWDHTPDDPEPGHTGIEVEALLNGDDGWRLVLQAESTPRDLECTIKEPHDPHRYRPEGVDWPVIPYGPGGWLECAGLIDLAGYDTSN
jgi:hypothetical protein